MRAQRVVNGQDGIKQRSRAFAGGRNIGIGWLACRSIVAWLNEISVQFSD